MYTFNRGGLHRVDGRLATVKDARWVEEDGDLLLAFVDTGEEVWLDLQNDDDLDRLEVA